MLIKKIFIILLWTFLACTIYSKYVFKSAILGVYQNVNFENSPIFPDRDDKLILNLDGTFESESFGKGSYEIEYSIKGTNINFEPNSEFGIDINTYISRAWTGVPQILLFKDLGHYYKKISSKDSSFKSSTKDNKLRDQLIEKQRNEINVDLKKTTEE